MTTYDTKITLDLAHLPKIDENGYNDEGDLYDELLDIHNAIEQLASNHDECCFNVEDGEPVTYCEKFGIAPGLETLVQEAIYTVDSDGSYVNGVIGQLKNDSLLAVKSNNIYWLKQVAGTLAPPEQMKNELRFSTNFGQTWTIAARGYDDWTAAVWGDYTANNYPANTTIRNMTATSTGIIYAAQHSDTYNHIIYEVPFGGGAVTEDHRPLHSCFTYTGQGQNWTGQSWKTGGTSYILLTSSKKFLTCGSLDNKLDGIINISLGSSFYDSRTTTSRDWFPPGDEDTGELEDGARITGNGLPRPKLVQDTVNSAGGQEHIDCQQIAVVGYRTYISAGINDIWYYDSESVELIPEGNYREMDYSEWSDNSNQFIPVETQWSWKYLEGSEPGIITDRNAVQLSESSTPWGWFRLTRAGYSQAIVWPKSGVEDNGANKGIFHAVYAGIDENGFDYSEWFLNNQGLPSEDREPLPDKKWRSYLYSEQDIDLSSLLVPLDPNETTLDICRVYTDVNYPGERFILVYAFNHTDTADGWPLRFYVRAAGHFTGPDDFSDPVTIENPVIAGSNPAGVQLAARQAGGWRLQYSSSESKFVTATIYLTNPGTYKEVVATFDDPFVCLLTGTVNKVGTGSGKQDGNYFYYDEGTDSYIGISPDDMGLIPDGGTTNQRLVKASDANKDVTWADREPGKTYIQPLEPTDWIVGDFWLSEGYE